MQPLAARFQAYVQQLTGLLPEWSGGAGVSLPAYLRQRFEGRVVTVAGQRWLVAFLKGVEPPPPLQLREQLEQMAARAQSAPTGICLVAEQLPPYLRRRLVELRQPFVIPGRQLFWPQLGSAETVQRPQRLRPRPVAQLEPIAQQLLIALVLRRLLAPVTINAAAAALGCTAASVSQAVKALEGSDLISSRLQGRERVFELREAPHATWQRAETLLRSPVRRRLRVMAAALPEGAAPAAGESALATLTDLGAPAEPILAATSRVWNQQAVAPVAIPTPDLGTCVVELWRYPPEATANRGTVDPLSLFLSLREVKDERVQSALTQLLEQVPW